MHFATGGRNRLPKRAFLRYSLTMMKAPLPENEKERLQALYECEVLDTEAEAAFDNLTRLAVYICKTPIALITLIDSDRQWFKSRIELSESETSRDVSFCAHAILEPGPTIVKDALQDDRFKDNPLVLSGPKIRFYAGASLTTKAGYNLGTMCVIDRQPRELSNGQISALRVLGQQASLLLETRREYNLSKYVLERERNQTRALQETLEKVRRIVN
jgi:hypothetical protein